MSLPVLGIDLGTTHTVVASAPLGRPPEVFPVSQWVSATEQDARALLPSYLFAPLPGEAVSDPWGDAPWILGHHARQRGQEVPTRLISSAKSWLSHARVDRQAPILPWGSDANEFNRLSPVDASARLLAHVRSAWDAAHPDSPAASLPVVIVTVPASFDQVARELTVDAAARAGLKVRLLEEPQAAFYDLWSRLGARALPDEDDALVLVVDVGGGTTDLTLISVVRQPETVKLRRLAVGKHLLLGGDNIDLALAHLAESRLAAKGSRLEPQRFAQLVLACRNAKERLLSQDAPESVRVAVLGAGSALVGSTLKTDLGRDEVRSLVLNGFVPLVGKEESVKPTRAGLMAFGLPYEHDPAITRHIASFLARHAPEGRAPDAVLLNGGLFHSAVLAERVLEVIAHFGGAPRCLPGADPDLAVARGAVAHAHALLGSGTLIGGGSAHGFFVALSEQSETPRAVCVVPRGAQEGARHVIDRKFALRVGEPVRFEVYTTDRGTCDAGSVVQLDHEEYVRLAPIAATLPAQGDATEIVVQLSGELSPVGTVELECLDIDAGDDPTAHHRLSFDTRGETPEEAPEDVARKSLRPGRAPSMRPEGPRFEEACAAVDLVFGKSRSDVKERTVKELWRTLEKLLGDRSSWSGELSRSLFDVLSPNSKSRTRSAAHERVFWMLAGFTLRPGYGHPLDASRIKRIAPLFEAGLSFPDEARGWQQLWIAWRRLAGGLDEALQTRIRDRIDPFLAPAGQGPKRPKGYKPQAADEMLELAAALERVPAERRAQLGEWLIERTWSERNPRLWSVIGKLGARVPTYASAHYVVAPRVAESWLSHALGEKWDEQPLAARAARDLARVSGDRARDLSVEVRERVAKALDAFGADADWSRSVRELVPLADADRAEFFGAELPLGLRLAD
ncbi:MAG: Hsp70 family protein [Polyangiaceae bacterium]